jgi:hypothetical protein
VDEGVLLQNALFYHAHLLTSKYIISSPSPPLPPCWKRGEGLTPWGRTAPASPQEGEGEDARETSLQFSAPAPQGLPQQTPVWGLGPAGRNTPSHPRLLSPPLSPLVRGFRRVESKGALGRLPFRSSTVPKSLIRPYWRLRSPPPLAGGGRARPRGVMKSQTPLLGAGTAEEAGTARWPGGGQGFYLPNLPPHPSPAWGEGTPFAALTPLRWGNRPPSPPGERERRRSGWSPTLCGGRSPPPPGSLLEPTTFGDGGDPAGAGEAPLPPGRGTKAGSPALLNGLRPPSPPMGERKKGREKPGGGRQEGVPSSESPWFGKAGSPHHLTGGGWAPPPPGGAPRGSPPSSRR